MRARALSGIHLGQRVTVKEGGNTAAGTLSRVDHRSTVITDRSLGGWEHESLGGSWVDLEFLGKLTIHCTPDAEVWIEV